MITWQKFCENMGGGLPAQAPNYATSARPADTQNMDIGQAHLHLNGNSLMIDTNTHSINLPLTPQQLQQLKNEFAG